MSGRIDRFKKRKDIIKSNQSLPLTSGVVDQESVEVLLIEGANHQRLGELDHTTDLSFTLEVDPEEVKSLLLNLRSEFNEKRVEQLLEETKNGIVSSIVGPFGLGKLMSAYDKEGGNVDTVLNVRKGVYATSAEKTAYDERGDYNTHEVHSDCQFINVNREHSKQQKSEGIDDTYSDEIIKTGDNKNLDHVYSGRQTHDDAGRVLAEINTEKLANINENLKPTTETVNKSKGAKSPEKFASYLETTAVERKDRIQSLKNRENNLTDKEKKELQKLTDLDKADPEKIRNAGREAQEAQDKEINKYYSSNKFIKNTLGTGVNEGVKMGAQQAFGILLVEFFSASFAEIRLAFNAGLEGESLYKDIKIRLERIGRKIAKKWKDTIKGFSGGFISGFISNLITTLINVFITTGKRVVRMIREGVFSLLKALKLIMFPPADMSYQEAVHAAMKLIAVGGIVVVGVLLEESIEKLVLGVPFLAPFATIVTAVIVGSLTAIAMSLVTYLIDKMDLLGVIKIEETKYILNGINGSIGETIKRCESVTEDIDSFLYQDTPLLPAKS